MLILELSLPATAVARLWRHTALDGTKRARAVAEHWHWLDSAEGVLAEAGQALRVLATPAGARQLLALRPAAGALPGAPPPPPRALEGDAAPEAAAGAALHPLARYAGKRVEARAGEVLLTLEQGSLQAGAAEQGWCLLRLQGPAAPVLELAQSLALTLPLLPAAAGLDEAALALAAGRAVPPRHKGAPDLGAAASVPEALAIAIGHLAGVLLAQAPQARPDAGPEAVHQLRVAARRLRSCLKVFRKVVDNELLRALDAGLRDAARALGAAREWDVFLGGLAKELTAALGPDDKRWQKLLARAAGRRLAAYDAVAGLLAGAEFRATLWLALQAAARPELLAPPAPPPPAEATESLPDSRPLPGLRDQARSVLGKRRRKLLRGGAEIAALSDADLHALRLEAKRLRYAAELFAPLWPGKATRRFLKRLSALQEALGLSNDTVTARALMASLSRAEDGVAAAPPWSIGLAEGWALAATRDMRRQALLAWKGFSKLDPFWEHG
ncbi:CHAD domain-containing protein [Roseomonas sp. 18066]|uniref:CYTH and CHAD domain-containing protein n=1 Tax=Roseomonas sp. 18066 TaxID=2681412 RepID=UPI001359574C|nr:CHAD domain-containing protein [Roseomonas sp. 18066]